MENLTDISSKYLTDKGLKSHIKSRSGEGHMFTKLYDKLLSPIRKKANNILEIGIHQGGSLKMWKEYFENATIHGVDIKSSTMFDEDRISTYIADQSNRDELSKIMESIGQVDVIVEDGGHTMEQQQISLGFLFNFLKPGGIYIIEDLQTSFPRITNQLKEEIFGVNKDRSNTTYEMIQNLFFTGKIHSDFISDSEKELIEKEFDRCFIAHSNLNEANVDMFAVIIKKS